MKKFKFSSQGLVPRVIGAAAGGGVNAAFDKYLADMLVSKNSSGVETSYASYVKAGIGLLLPIVSSNKMIETGANVLLGIGISDIVKKVLPDSESAVPPTTAAEAGVSYVGRSSHVGASRRRVWLPPLDLSQSAKQQLSSGSTRYSS
jgi:hypothetical protein